MEDQKQPKSNNEKLILGIILGAILGFILYWSINMVAGFSENIFLILITIFVTIIILFLVSIWGRKYVVRKLFGKNIDFDDVIEKSQETINSITDNVSDILPLKSDTKEDIKKYAPKLISFLIWSRYRNWSLRVIISFLVALGSLVVTILTLNQNRLIEDQNKRIDQQTELINQQNILSESSRRSSQMFIMSDVLSDVNKELNEIEKNNKKRILSKTLTGRIISLSRSMRPYRYIKNVNYKLINNKFDSKHENDLIEFSEVLSPERGQLLITLLSSELDTSYFIHELIKKPFIEMGNSCDFTYSDLKKVNLSNQILPGINLSYSDMSESIIHSTNLDGSHLDNSILNNTVMNYVNLKNVISSHGKFNNSRLYKVDIRNAHFYWVSFKEASFLECKLTNGRYIKSSFEKVFFKNVNLKGSKFNYCNFTGAIFEGVNLDDSDISGAEFRDANFQNINSLDSVIVDRPDWIYNIVYNLKLKGSEKINELYEVKAVTPVVEGSIISTSNYIIVKK